jgi:hypothetical protein
VKSRLGPSWRASVGAALGVVLSVAGALAARPSVASAETCGSVSIGCSQQTSDAVGERAGSAVHDLRDAAADAVDDRAGALPTPLAVASPMLRRVSDTLRALDADRSDPGSEDGSDDGGRPRHAARSAPDVPIVASPDTARARRTGPHHLLGTTPATRSARRARAVGGPEGMRPGATGGIGYLANGLRFPMLLAALILLFVSLQQRLDGRDPKLARSPPDRRHDEIGFG